MSIEDNTLDNRPSSYEKDGSDRDNGSSVIGMGYAATMAARNATLEAAKNYAKPEQYKGNRQIYDNGNAKKNAKLELFKEGNSVVDPYTGEALVLTKKEAKLLYGEKWQNHFAESDHIKPLERIFEETKNNVWNTTDDIRNAANSNDNLSVTSRKFNNPKRNRTNEEYVKDKEYLKEKGVEITEEGKTQALKDGELAEKAINQQLKTASFNNMVKTGHNAGIQGAKGAAGTALTISGVMNLVAVIKGEKSSDEAIADTVRDGGKAAATGYVMSGGLTVVSHTLSNTSSAFIKGLVESNVPGKVITAVIVTGDTLKKWGNGEITTQECIIELGEKGLNMATMGYSMIAGQALIPVPVVGGAIGALVGSLLTSQFYNELIMSLKNKEFEHQERLRIIEECKLLSEQTIRYREELESYLRQYFVDYRDCFNEAISSMNFTYEMGDADGIILAANSITRKLGGQVKYDSVDEFRELLKSNSPDVL